MQSNVAIDSEIPFSAGAITVHPAHGVGRVRGIETREAGGQRASFYVVDILEGGTRVLVAVNAARSVLRAVMSRDEAEAVLAILRAHEVAVDVQPWSRRHRIYAEMLRSGAPREIAKVLRDMHRQRGAKGLSFSERRLFDQARSLLVHELALAMGSTRAAIEAEMNASLATS